MHYIINRSLVPKQSLQPLVRLVLCTQQASCSRFVIKRQQRFGKEVIQMVIMTKQVLIHIIQSTSQQGLNGKLQEAWSFRATLFALVTS